MGSYWLIAMFLYRIDCMKFMSMILINGILSSCFTILSLCILFYQNALCQKDSMKTTPSFQDTSYGISQEIIQEVSPGVLQIGKIKIILDHRTVEFPAVVNMSRGLIEYALVGNNGKVHESLLRTDILPSKLNIAFLLLGFKGTNDMDQKITTRDTLFKGEAINIFVRYRDQKDKSIIPIENWISNENHTNLEIPWIYTGSFFLDHQFAADAEQSIIAVYHDPAALIDHRLVDGDNDEIWYVNDHLVPAEGTPVYIKITMKHSMKNERGIQ